MGATPGAADAEIHPELRQADVFCHLPATRSQRRSDLGPVVIRRCGRSTDDVAGALGAVPRRSEVRLEQPDPAGDSGPTVMSSGSNEQKTITSSRARVTDTFSRRSPPFWFSGPKFIGTL